MERFAPLVTRNIIFINIILWLLQRIMPNMMGIDLTDILGMHYWQAGSFRLYQMVTYLFLHSTSDFFHLLGNMFMLWMFGSVIERFWGSHRYLIFYIITGITAALTQQFIWHLELHDVASNVNILYNIGGGELLRAEELLNLPITIGASGAVFGLLLAYGMLFPNAEMYYMFLPIPIKAKYIVLLFGLYELFMGVKATGSSIAHFAHLGGMVGGIVLILMWRKKGLIDGPYN